MPTVITYDDSTREQFDADTQGVLDLIQKEFPVVEIELPTAGKPMQWFVQVYRKAHSDMPEGFFGKTPLEAAERMARALKIMPL